MLLWTFGCMHLFELWFSLGIRPVMGLLGHNLLLSRFPHLGKFFIHSVSLNIHKDDLSNTIALHLLRLLLWCHVSLWPTLLFLVSFAINHLTTAFCSYYPQFPHSWFHPQSSSNEESGPPKSMMNFMSCLYILGINLLSAVSFAVIFSHSEGCLFTLFIVSFSVQKLLNVIRSYLFFVFTSIILGGGS